jgi:hypothetical protein
MEMRTTDSISTEIKNDPFAREALLKGKKAQYH